MTTDLHARTTPAGGGSDDFLSLWDMAFEAYLVGVRADPDGVAVGDAWDLALAEVDEHVQDSRRAAIRAALDALDRWEPAKGVA